VSTITSNGTGGGNWSATATWAGSVVPVNGDDVVIAANDTVTFDVDQSGFANGIAGITLNAGAKIVVSTSAGTYCLKTSATITSSTGSGGAAYFEAGDLTTALPANVSFTIELTANTIDLFTVQDEPSDCDINILICDAKGSSDDANRHAALTSDCESAAVLALRENIDALEVGDTVEICRAKYDFETGVVQSIDSEAKTVTLTGAVSKTYEAGSDVVCLTSNIEIFGTGPGNGSSMVQGNLHNSTIRAAVHDFKTGIESTPGHCRNNVGDGPWYELMRAFFQGTSNVFAGTYRAASGNYYWSYNPKNHILAPSGLIYGTYRPNYNYQGELRMVYNGRISNGDYGPFKIPLQSNGLELERLTYCVYSCTSTPGGGVRNLTIRGHNQGFSGGTARFVARNVEFVDTNNNDFISAPIAGDEQDSGLSDWFKFYNFTDPTGTYARYKRMTCGSIKTDSTPPAGGPSEADEWTFTDNACPLYWDERVLLGPGERVNATCWAQKAQAMDAEFTLELIEPDDDPFDLYPHEPTRTGYTTLAADAMTADADTWEKLAATHVNSGSGYQEVIVRVRARNGSGTGHAKLDIKRPEGAGLLVA